jgi:AhpD family alkylhydroperoxidase
LDAVEKQLGVVPNLFRLVALSPAALQGFLGFNGALRKALDVRTRERIAIAVAQLNGCDYCLSAHIYLGLNLAKIDIAEIALNRRGASSDPRANAAVAFARKIAENPRRAAEAQVIEIIAVVAENVFTNLVNIVAGTDIDFPVIRSAEAA